MTTETEAKTKIEEAARALAAALQEDPRWTAWQKAQKDFEEDAELPGLMNRYQQLAQKAQQAQRGGEALSGEEIIEISTVQKKIQDNDRFRAHNQASGELVQSLQESNEYLSTALGLDYASTAAPKSSCC